MSEVIEMEGNGLFNLLTNVPPSLFNKVKDLSSISQFFTNEIQVEVLFGENVDNVRQAVDNLGGIFENLGYGFGIITIPVDKLQELSTITDIQYLELPKLIANSSIDSLIASCVPQVWQGANLSGAGVLIGFIDTGIDYTINAFRNEDGTTRIVYLYDLIEQVSYNREEINSALKSSDPYSIVNFTDSTGHGTQVAGIACAGGNIDRSYYGAAYNSLIAMVKITAVEGINFSLSTQLMRGIKLLVDRARELRLPLVINISWSTNDGAHNGSSILEQYINTISSNERVTIVIAAGNEGNAAHHVGGEISEDQLIELQIAEEERGLVLQLYAPVLSELVLEVRNPTGATTGEIPLIEGYRQYSIDRDIILIYNTGPKPFNVEGEIAISIVPAIGDTIASGQWNLTLRNTSEYSGRYDMWMPISESLRAATRFLNPDIYNTLGIPATVQNVISVGSYNYQTLSISPFSGRGIYGRGFIKPDLVAPGEDIVTTLPRGSFGPKTGTSMAAPQVSGIAALLTEWGLIQGNDPFLYGDRLKYYLIRSATRRRLEEEYPSPTWGYGRVCAEAALELLLELIPSAGRRGYFRVEEQPSVSQPSQVEVPPQSIEEDIQRIIRTRENYLNPEYGNYVAQYTGDIVGELYASGLGTAIIIDERYAVVSVPRGDWPEVEEKVNSIVFIDPGRFYVLNAISPIEAAEIPFFQTNPFLNLTGRGVYLAIIDTGIDYLNPEFQFEDGSTKIFRIWDQTIQTGTPPEDLIIGSEYTEEQINAALELYRQGGDPYSIVPTRDTNGHGTNMAGIMGAKGQNPLLTGAAPDAKFIIVKLRLSNTAAFIATEIPLYTDADIIMALKYVFLQARNGSTPISALLPLSTNLSPHDGSLLIEQYIDYISTFAGIVITVPAGNEGFSDTHTEGRLKETGASEIIELQVGEGESNIIFDIWFQRPDRVSISITSPSGEILERIPIRERTLQRTTFVFERTEAIIFYNTPDPNTGDENITILLTNLVAGIWKFTLYGEAIYNGGYNAWLPNSILLKEGTRFLSSSQNITITSPATAARAISIGFYNQNTNTADARSGRGFTRTGAIKPDLVAGGVDALVISPGGGTTTRTGSSVAGAVTAGAIALLLQWKILIQKDTSFYSEMVETYLIAGAERDRGEVYPSRQLGYGKLNLYNTFEALRNSYRLIKTDDNVFSPIGLEEEEYTLGSLYVRKPGNLIIK